MLDYCNRVVKEFRAAMARLALPQYTDLVYVLLMALTAVCGVGSITMGIVAGFTKVPAAGLPLVYGIILLILNYILLRLPVWAAEKIPSAQDATVEVPADGPGVPSDADQAIPTDG